jgi:hypothetical protein
MRWRIPLFAALALFVAGGCNSDPPLVPNDQEPVEISLQIVGGQGQQGPPGEWLPAPLVVQVTEQKGQNPRPIRDQVVNFRVVEGGGEVYAGAAITNSSGIAQERWKLGYHGAQAVEARAVDSETGEPLNFGTFSATLLTTRYMVGGTVTGLTGTGLVLQNNGQDDLSIEANGEFVFPNPIDDGDGYSVTVATQPTGQLCEVLTGSGTVSGADVTDVLVDCALSDSDGDGYPDNQDCRPDDPNINPDAEDRPDAAAVDSNCDGIDGDMEVSLFVNVSGGTDAGECTLENPCATIGRAMDLAVPAGRWDILISLGVYSLTSQGYPSGILAMRDGVSLYGSYDATLDWARAFGGTPTEIRGRIDAEQVSGLATYLADLTISGPDATGTGESSYTVYVNGAGDNLTIARNVISAGAGTNGANGVDGTEAPSLARAASGSSGEPGQEFATACNDTDFGAGGAGAGSGGRAGGAGGDGGRMDAECSSIGLPIDATATAGNSGERAALYSSGGFGWYGNGGLACSAGQPGMSGRTVIHGIHGLPGSGGWISAGEWVPAAGGNGALGQDGTGGGGGGGSGGCDVGVDEYGAGGGGGGAGGLRASGAGTGGQGGGASIGLFITSATPRVTSNRFVLGTAGRGGNGGNAGLGQPGGWGGPGGAAGSPDGGPGGDGGDGSNGGNSGMGGGGAGGMSVGILIDSASSNPTMTGNTFEGGIAGAGGQPGLAASADQPTGAAGQNGQVLEVLSI